MTCIRKSKENEENKEDANLLLTTALKPLYLGEGDNKTNLSERLQDSVKRSNNENNKLYEMQQVYESLSKKLDDTKKEMVTKENQRVQLIKEVQALKIMFVGNQLDIYALNNIVKPDGM